MFVSRGTVDPPQDVSELRRERRGMFVLEQLRVPQDNV
jgi:hypothetical protein